MLASAVSAMSRMGGLADDPSVPSGPAKARQRAGWPAGWVISATSWACRPRRSDWTAMDSPSPTGTGPASVSSISRIVSSTRFLVVTWSSSRSRSMALAA